MTNKAFAVGDEVAVNNRMQSGYRYRLDAGTGRDFDPGFTPELPPAEGARCAGTSHS